MPSGPASSISTPAQVGQVSRSMRNSPGPVAMMPPPALLGSVDRMTEMISRFHVEPPHNPHLGARL